ncbi:MAG: histidine--tRNA ligase [Alphaproteobacteria bacterium]|nr:histidine--tRNA ligase [Alphaproteobacteria bacterium]
MSEKLQPVRGTHDLLPADFARHQHVIETAQKVAALYGYARMDTPIFEFSDVFHRTLGDTSDVVTKETYTFTDRGGESLTLRPEFTAAIVRSFISNNLQQLPSPFKCFYAGPAFRYERPQKGRQRQFHQIGCELLGSNEPLSDVEMIALAAHTLRVLGLFDSVTLELNSLGDAASRAAYRDALVEYLSKYKNDLSDDSKARLEKNPLRILDSKDEGDKKIVAGAPTLHAHFNDASKAHFDAVRAGLEALGIAYKVSEKLVRGLDYYSHTVFEFTTDKLGAQGTVLAGGRYNDLVKVMGGNDTACIGFAAGVERLSALIESSYKTPPVQLVAVVPMQESTEAEAWKLAQALRGEGLAVDIAYKGNTKKRFERASKLGAAYAVLMGEEELAKGEVMVKNLADGSQTPVKQDQLVAWLKSR